MVLDNEVLGLVCFLGFLLGLAYMGFIWACESASQKKKLVMKKYMSGLDDGEYRKFNETFKR